ncbi:MAG TPA: WD40 repeat domain-containing protein [Chloroflexia bacterium]
MCLFAVILLSASGCGTGGSPLAWPPAPPAPGLARILSGHTLWVSSIAWSPDGKMIASGSGDTTLKVWDVASGSNLKSLTLDRGSLASVAWSPNGEYLAVGHNEPSDRVRIWDMATWQPVLLMNPKGAMRVVSYSPDGEMLAVGLGFADPDPKHKPKGSGAAIYDARTGAELVTLYLPEDVISLAWSPDSKYLAFRASVTDPAASPTDLGYVMIWDLSGALKRSNANDLSNPDRLRRLDGLNGKSNVDWSPDGKLVAAGDGDELKFVDTSTWTETPALTGSPDGAGHIAWSPNGKWLALGGSPSVEIWDVAKQKQVSTFPLFDAVNDIKWSPDSKFLATGSEDHYVRIWEVK